MTGRIMRNWVCPACGLVQDDIRWVDGGQLGQVPSRYCSEVCERIAGAEYRFEVVLAKVRNAVRRKRGWVSRGPNSREAIASWILESGRSTIHGTEVSDHLRRLGFDWTPEHTEAVVRGLYTAGVLGGVPALAGNAPPQSSMWGVKPILADRSTLELRAGEFWQWHGVIG